MEPDRIALVTGANKGIGREIARQLARRGFIVVVAARDRERGEEAAAAIRAEGGDARAVVLDVTRGETIVAAAEWAGRAWGRLDALINNAAIARGPHPAGSVDVGAIREVFETNVFGVIAVTEAMLPLLREGPAGRIVNMSSSLGSLTRSADPENRYASLRSLGYVPSKTALNAITVAYANALRGTAIKVNAACPGYTKTDLNEHRGTRTVEQAARTPVRLAMLPADGPTAGFFDDDGVVPW
jgi:NAD(P)-dependent dehydrogenase (short-subunit alcohol dehydrogenase family)